VSRVLAICLDGYEPSLALAMMNAGEMPAMRDLAERSARYRLDHGPDLRTGLAGEHVATGLSATDASRWAAVHFNRDTYEVWQQGTTLPPFPSRYPFRTVVFDPPYFDLAAAPGVVGMVNWGAHDPGVAPAARPAVVMDEILQRFGAYPAGAWIYGTPWNSVERAGAMGEHLAGAVRLRAQIAAWLFKQRLPDWDLAILTVSEAHSAIEGLWHGIDECHPLHGLPSSAVARAGVRAVYREIDALVRQLQAEVPDATVVVFSMHGMGANGSDPASMFLLGELLYRHAFHAPRHNWSGELSWVREGVPALPESQAWAAFVRSGFRNSAGRRKRPLARRLGDRLARMLRPTKRDSAVARRKRSIDWMPIADYRQAWPLMPAFALPSFYDGRIRLNVKGRESRGTVPLERYARVRDEIADLVRQCRNPAGGGRVVKAIEFPDRRSPLEIGETESDLIVVWDDAPLGLTHPDLGTVGPVPYRRSGGHTGQHGFAYFAGESIDPGERNVASSYDVIPTILDLLGVRDDTISGSSVLHRDGSAPPHAGSRAAVTNRATTPARPT